MNKLEVWLLNEREVATLLGVSVATTQRWRLFGEGPKFLKLGSKLGSAVKYRRQDVEAWLDAQPTGGGQAK